MTEHLLKLEIVSPEGIIYQNTATEVIVPSIEGELAILPLHAPLFTKLVEGEIVVKDKNKTQNFAILGGFLEVTHNTVSILADYAIAADSINAAKAEEAKKTAEKLLKEKSDNVDFVEIEKDLRKAIMELKVTEKVKRRH